MDKLVKQLQSCENEPINISDWLEYYTFDFMGKFGLTIDFNNLSRGQPHPILALYHMAHRKLGPLAAAPWIKHLLMGIPYIERMKYYRQFMDWAATELDRNIKVSQRSRLHTGNWKAYGLMDFRRTRRAAIMSSAMSLRMR